MVSQAGYGPGKRITVKEFRGRETLAKTKMLLRIMLVSV